MGGAAGSVGASGVGAATSMGGARTTGGATCPLPIACGCLSKILKQETMVNVINIRYSQTMFQKRGK